MKWPSQPLGEVCQITSGGTPSRKKPEYYDSGTIPWVKTGDLKQKYVIGEVECITDQALKESSAKLFPADTVLLALYGATIGACSILQYEAATNQACAALLPSELLDSEYLFYYLTTRKSDLIAQGQGGAQPNISGSILKRYPVPLPPLEEQRRIAQVLSLADGLRQKARSMQEELDALAQSLFLNMFGDPVSSDSVVHPMEPLGNHLAEIESGWSPTCDKEWTSEDQWGVLELGAVTKGVYLSNKVKPLPTSLAAKPKLEVQTGDLLFSRKNTRELVGACAYVFESAPRRMIPDTIFRLRLNNSSQLRKEYIWGLFNQPGFKRRIQNLAGGSAGSMPNISKAKLWTLAVPVPDPQRQVQFADQLWELERKRTGCKEYSMNLQDLFNSLLQKAFKGELTFNDAAFKALETEAGA